MSFYVPSDNKVIRRKYIDIVTEGCRYLVSEKKIKICERKKRGEDRVNRDWEIEKRGKKDKENVDREINRQIHIKIKQIWK